MNRRNRSENNHHRSSSYASDHGELPTHLAAEDRSTSSSGHSRTRAFKMMLPTRQLYKVCLVLGVLIFMYGVWSQLSIYQTSRTSPFASLVPGGPPTVTIRQGTYVGETVQFGALRGPVDQFLGLPYALPPNGTRRYRPAEKLPSSSQTFDATKFGSRCPSKGGFGIDSEDCLVADVVRPKGTDSKKKLPVLVYVHGGAFVGGSSRERKLANMVTWSEKPFIAVSFNYRLGALGFLPSPSLAKEGNLNLGLKDQRLLFEWVQENIAAFGGDPRDVTLAGSSAGAHSLGHHLMSSNGKKPLFKKMIIESGASTARALFPYDHKLPQQQYKEFLDAAGLSGLSEDAVIQKLRSVPFETIRDAQHIIWTKYDPSVRWPFQPALDGPGGFIPKAPIEAWRAAEWHKIPILTGFNTDEGAMFVPHKMQTSVEFDKFFETLLPNYQKAELDRLKVVYPDPTKPGNARWREDRPGLGAQAKRVIAAYGQWAYIAPVRQTAHFASLPAPANAPPSETARPPVYLWHFAVNNSVAGGANHGDHSKFVTYNEETTKKSAAMGAIAGNMHAYFTSFITTGDPNTVKGRFPDRPNWEPYQAKDGKKMVFGEGNDEFAGGKGLGTPAKLVDDTWAKMECDFWWSKTELSER